MAEIVGAEGYTVGQLQAELAQGSRIVVFQYCISVIVLSFRRSSGMYLIRPGESGAAKSVPFTLAALFLGWWGIPWGPIWTIQSLYRNLKGGRDVTDEVARSLYAPY